MTVSRMVRRVCRRGTRTNGMGANGARAAFLLLSLVISWGCQPAPRPSQAAPLDHSQVDPSREGSSQAAAGEQQPQRETWDAIFFGDSQVGFSHTRYETLERDGQPLVQITARSELTIQRFNQTTRQRLEYRSLETPAGEVLEFDSSMSSGDAEAGAIAMETHGAVRNGMIDLRLSTLGKKQEAQLPWDKSWGGFFALEQSLERKPLLPGEKRTLRALTPGFNQTAEVEFVAHDWESTTTLEGPRQLLRIATTMQLGANKLEQTVWTDERGQTIKTAMPALQQLTYRTTAERAKAKSRGKFDLGQQSIVRLEQPLENPHHTRRITYRATLEGRQPADSLATGVTQAVRKTGEHSAEIMVRSLGPTEPLGEGFPAEAPPAGEDLAANNLIQSDDPEIAKLANEVAGERTDPWEVATALERRVHQTINRKDFSQALSSAAEVIRSRQGDCTEHAVLLAALCRARQIPARVVIGLVYHAPSRGFAYHMWTVVWIRDRWLPLDATLGQGGIGAAHLAVSQSNLEGTDPLAHFLPVVQWIGSLRLEVVKVE